MSTHPHFDRICVVVLVVALIVTVLYLNGEALGIRKVVDSDAEAHSDSQYFTVGDLNGSWDASEATVITLRDGGADISGVGAYVLNGSVVIAQSGQYVLSGTLTDGAIVVDAYQSSKVWLLLDGAEVFCPDNAALRVEQADKVFLTLAEGSENRLESGPAYGADARSDNVLGTVFAHDDLTVNGSGSLTITGAYRHGIDANDDLVITGGDITIDAAGDAIHVNDSLRICGASLTLTAGDEGIDVDGEGGYFYMESGAIDIVAGDDGVHTEGAFCLAGGSVTLAAGDDGIHSETTLAVSGGELTVSECGEGLEAFAIELSGGSVTIQPTDDGLNATDGSGGFGGFGPAAARADPDELPYVRITGGELTIRNLNARDADGIDSNGSIYITGGSIRIALPSSGYALDVGSENGGVMEISGGELIGLGGYAMAESFDLSSEQCSILYAVSDGVPAGSVVALEDLRGRTLLRYEAPCEFSCIHLSSPALTLGESYRVIIGDDVEEITLAEVSASYGNAQSSMFGGTMNWGGMQPRDAFNWPGGTGGPRPSEWSGGEKPAWQSGGDQPAAPPEGGAPEPPDGELPETPGQNGPGGQRPGGEMPPGGFAQPEGTQPPDLPEEPEAPSADSGYDGTVYLWLGISCGVMLLGLLFALVYGRIRLGRKRRAKKTK